MGDNITSFINFFKTIGQSGLVAFVFFSSAYAVQESVQACLIPANQKLTPKLRQKIAHCLDFKTQLGAPGLCKGQYRPIALPKISPGYVEINADTVSFMPSGRSKLQGHVLIEEDGKRGLATTAYIIRDAKTHQITQIELLDGVVYEEADKKIIASKAIFQPEEKTGQIYDVLYRLNQNNHKHAVLPAWGIARYIERFKNEDFLLKSTTYTTCAPTDKAWEISAKEITLDKSKESGIAKNAALKIRDVPVFYTPFMTFPYTDKRKSGFLMPVYGYTNVGGYDFALPYYWNIAPNYDTTVTPHYYALRGLMLGADTRFLTQKSSGFVNFNFLSHDKAYANFLKDHGDNHRSFLSDKTSRWSLNLNEHTQVTQRLKFDLNYQQVSDDYYLQDFSNNLAIVTQRQLPKEAQLLYSGDIWTVKGLLQGYQTLKPINEIYVDSVYQRLPQVSALGHYNNLPFRTALDLEGQVDAFQWPDENPAKPNGPRWHVNPVLSQTWGRPWGYARPSVEFVENYYNLGHTTLISSQKYNRFIPRYSLDTGLNFERKFNFSGTALTQTLEPRVFYLNVPYYDQTQVPVFDSGYMIFTTDQLFRKNRFSGFDRIGDTNEISYALTSRWLDSDTAYERAEITLGQIHYFSTRKVGLCQSIDGICFDSPLTLGYLSPTANFSPVVGHLGYHFTQSWLMSGDYAWDPATQKTNNGHLDLHYKPSEHYLFNLGYTYLINGDLTQVARNAPSNDALHQASISMVWPFRDNWSGIGAYQYNISKGYSMMSLAGLQYESCCWAMRLMGGHAFQSFEKVNDPKYNNSVFLQILLKGLGTVSSSDPATTIHTFVPGYQDIFH